MLLILDLDETLIRGQETPLEGIPSFAVGPFLIHKRPHLEAFLAYALEHFSVAVWTSASRDYALGIIQAIFPDPAALEFVFALEQCTRRNNEYTLEPYWIKDLRKIKKKFPLEQVIILDDSPEKLERHYGNLVRMPAWEGKPLDTALLEVIPFLERCKVLPDVRPLEKRGWYNNT